MEYLYPALFSLIVAIIVGLLVYRDAITQSLTHRIIWSFSTGIISGIGTALSFEYAGRIVFAVTNVVYGYYGITHPFLIPVTYIFLSFISIVLAVSIYRFAVPFTSPLGSAG
jgi:hypothetical protein